MVGSLVPGDPEEVAGYRLRGRLGSGGMGTVYLSHTRGGQPVALKLIRPDLAEDPEFRRRFEREVEAARRVYGPYTARVLDSNTDGPVPWLAGEYVPGPALSDAVRAYGPLPVETTLLLLAGVAEALESIHAAGVVHRDLKPSNVLLAADGPRVIDFGIARAADTTALTGSHIQVGTPAFMSPEQVLGKTVGFESDVFSLALVGYHAATGGHPFGEGHAQALMFRIVSEAAELTGCPDRLRSLLEPCLAKEAADRPSLAALIEECRRSADVTVLARGRDWLPAPIALMAAGLETTPAPGPTPEESAPSSAPPLLPPPSTPPPTPPSAAGVPTPAPDGAGVSQPDRPPYPQAAATSIPSPPPPGFSATPPGSSAMPPGFPAAPPEAPGRRRPRLRIAVSAVAAGAVVVAAAVFVPKLLDDDKSGTPGNGQRPDGTWTKTKDAVPLTIAASVPSRNSFYSNGLCVGGTATHVDLESVTVKSLQPDVGDAEVPPTVTAKYVACYAAMGDYDSPLAGELRFLDNRATAGRVDKPDVTVDECRNAARSASLPGRLPLEVLRAGADTLKNTGFCLETDQKTVLLLWIVNAPRSGGAHDLPELATKVTQWKPSDKS